VLSKAERKIWVFGVWCDYFLKYFLF
jgi:hypothetical protein